MVMAEHFDDNLIGVKGSQLKVFLREFHLPQSFCCKSDSRIFVAGDHELSGSANRAFELKFEPV